VGTGAASTLAEVITFKREWNEWLALVSQ